VGCRLEGKYKTVIAIIKIVKLNMANPWFKLYGVEMLSDPKYQRLNAGERSCWVTLLCLGSMDNGIIKFCEEQYLITHSGIDVMEIGKYHGILLKFEMLGMIKKCRDSIGMEYIEIKNWGKRQEVYSESKERVARWREKQKENRVVTPVTLRGNARIEEIRKEENREELSFEERKSKMQSIRKTLVDKIGKK
jgi:hypothetical protein